MLNVLKHGSVVGVVYSTVKDLVNKNHTYWQSEVFQQNSPEVIWTRFFWNKHSFILLKHGIKKLENGEVDDIREVQIWLPLALPLPSANQMSLACPIDKSDSLKIGIR